MATEHTEDTDNKKATTTKLTTQTKGMKLNELLRDLRVLRGSIFSFGVDYGF